MKASRRSASVAAPAPGRFAFRILLAVGLLTAAMVFWCPELSAEPATPKPSAKKMIIKGSQSVHWSAKSDAASLRAIQSGAEQLVITVSAYQPPAGNSAILVRLPTPDGKWREVDRFAVHPNLAFKASATTEPQRFLISLAPHAALIREGELRVEVGFDSTQNSVRGGMAEISIELAEPAPKCSAD